MREHLRAQLASFFISVTLINLAMLILGCLLEPDLQFGYQAFAYPLIYGIIGSLPGKRDHSDASYRHPHNRFHVRQV